MQKLLIKPEELKVIINNYYTNTIGIPDTEVSINNELGSIGYGPCESVGCNTSIIVKIKREVLGTKRTVEQKLTEEEIKQIIAAGLNSDNLTLNDFSLDNGVRNTCEGYGMSERTVDKPYFNGIRITFREQEKSKKNLT